MPEVPAVGGVGVSTALTTATPKPVGPSPPEQSFDPNAVTPGTIGFIVTFAMVVVVVFLLRDLTKRIRRITLKGEAAERRAAEEAAAGTTAAPAAPAGPPARGAGPGARAGRASPATGGRRPPSLKRPPGGTPTPTG